MRQALKEEKRVTFAREDYTEARAAVWSKGVRKCANDDCNEGY